MAAPVGQQNREGLTWKLWLILAPFVGVAAFVVGFPPWVLIVMVAAPVVGAPCVTWHFRRRELTPLERWSLAPAPRSTGCQQRRGRRSRPRAPWPWW